MGTYYEKIKEDIILKYVYDLYANNRYTDCDNDIYLNYAGIYSMYNDNNYELSEDYFTASANKGNVCAMYNLAFRYDKHKKYFLSMQCCFIAKEKGITLLNRELPYRSNGDELAEKYYLMAIERGHSYSMNDLAFFYYEQKKYDLSEKYFLMAADRGNITSMKYLERMYRGRGKHELSKHYLIASALSYHKMSLDEVNSMILNEFDLNDSIKLINVLNKHNQNVLNDVLKFIENEPLQIVI